MCTGVVREMGMLQKKTFQALYFRLRTRAMLFEGSNLIPHLLMRIAALDIHLRLAARIQCISLQTI